MGTLEAVNTVIYLLTIVAVLALIAVVLSAWSLVLRRGDRAALDDLGHRMGTLEKGHQGVIEIIAPLAPKPAPLPAYTPPPARDSTEPTYPTPPEAHRGTMLPRRR